MIAIFGGGGIAQGIADVVGGELITQAECDVRKIDQICRVMNELKPEVVICTAGISRPASFADMKHDDVFNEIETNLIGSFNVAKCAADIGATMIFIASVAGKYGKPNHAGYSASKAGVVSLVQSLGMEGYNAYAISPGRVNTAMRHRDYPLDTEGSRLEPNEIGYLVQEILHNKYDPGDNIIIRRIGFETVPHTIDKGEPWLTELKVGQPVTL